MFSVELMACAEGVVIDRRSNNVSIFNIINEFHSPIFPAAVSQITTLVVLTRDPEDSDPECELRVALDGKVLFKTPAKAAFGETTRNRMVFDTSMLPVPEPGDLCFSFFVEKRKRSEWHIAVSPQEPQVQVTSDNRSPSRQAARKA